MVIFTAPEWLVVNPNQPGIGNKPGQHGPKLRSKRDVNFKSEKTKIGKKSEP